MSSIETNSVIVMKVVSLPRKSSSNDELQDDGQADHLLLQGVDCVKMTKVAPALDAVAELNGDYVE